MAPRRRSRGNVDNPGGVNEDTDDFGERRLGSDSEIYEDELENRDSVNGDEDDVEAGGEEDGPEQRMQNVSFGALKQAHDSLARKRKRDSETTADQEEKLGALRTRLNEMRSTSKPSRNDPTFLHGSPEKDPVQPGSRIKSDRGMSGNENTNDDSDSAPSEEGNTKSRSSKHAPASQSSRRPVSRKRDVLGVPKRRYRDPRFDALQQQSTHTGNNAKAYSFLRDYEKDEITELKSAIKQTRNEEDKETLKRKMVSMQNRIKSQEAKEREQVVLKQHRREEKERVEQGKKPFYLKKKDVKERAIVEKFKGMKSKDREKLMQKRRRKEDQKEKRRMPDARRLD